jgi:hypothetical protein
MPPRHAVLVAVPLAALMLLASCGNREPVPQGPAVDPAGQVTLTAHTTISPGPGGEMFTEGAVPEVRLTASDGTVIEPRRDHVDDAVFPGIAPGRYRLTAALRPCDGNCGYLDPPTTPCSARVRVTDDQEVTVSWRVGQPCQVT